MPKRTKYRRPHRVKYEGKAKGGKTVAFGDYGLVALDGAWITSRQIEAARIAINRHMNRGGKVWIRIFPYKPVTQKGGEIPMGKGKGGVDHYVYPVKPGMVMYELDGLVEDVAKQALELAAYKLPIKCKFIKKD